MIDERDAAALKKLEVTKEEEAVVVAVAPAPAPTVVQATPPAVAVAPTPVEEPVVAIFAVIPPPVVTPDPARMYAVVEVDPMILEAAQVDPVTLESDPAVLELLEDVIQRAIDLATASANRGGAK